MRASAEKTPQSRTTGIKGPTTPDQKGKSINRKGPPFLRLDSQGKAEKPERNRSPKPVDCSCLSIINIEILNSISRLSQASDRETESPLFIGSKTLGSNTTTDADRKAADPFVFPENRLTPTAANEPAADFTGHTSHIVGRFSHTLRIAVA